MMRWGRWIGAVIGVLGAVAAAAQERVPAATRHWDRAVLATAARLPVQEGGRVKPLDTVARFMLLDLSGRTTYKDPGGERLTALEWFLDCWLRPRARRG